VSTTLLLTGPTLPLPESIWVIVGPGAILTVEATEIVNAATAAIITGTGIGIENGSATVLPVASTETVVTGTRIGTGVIERAPVVTLPIAGGEEATLAARLWGAPDVLTNVIVIDPKILVVSCHRLPVSGMQVIVLFKLSSFETPLPYCIKTSNSSCSVN